MKRTGQQSSVLNIDPRAPESDAYIRVSGGLDLARQLVRHVWNDWMLHVHTNGHNSKSWAIAFACGFAGQFGPGAALTLHSGMAPAYIQGASPWTRQALRLACLFYRRVVCVNEEIAGAITGLGIPKDHIEITPAFLPIEAPDVPVPCEIESWFSRHSPVISSTMFFRPEYGFELLLEAVSRLKQKHPRIGCLVMGAGPGPEGLGDEFCLAGDLDHELCLALMARADVYVRPTYRDGDSISVREAVALGVPVVASNVGTRPDGVSLFEPGDVDGLVEKIRSAFCRQEPK